MSGALNIGTIPARLIEFGGAVEEPGGLWHIAHTAETTYCGENCDVWPRVARAIERHGIWCGLLPHGRGREGLAAVTPTTHTPNHPAGRLRR
jgi:hypothetical protein